MDDRVDYVTAKQSGEILDDVNIWFLSFPELFQRRRLSTQSQSEREILITEIANASHCLDHMMFS